MNLNQLAKIYFWTKSNISGFSEDRLEFLILNWKGKVMIDEGGEIIIKEERDLTNPPILSGQNQSMTKDDYIKNFSEFLNSENPQNLLKSLFCDIPEKTFLDLTPDEQLDFVHKLDSCVKIIKVYSQSAEVNRRNKIETLDLEEQLRLKKKDASYKVQPREQDRAKLDQETKLQKMVRQFRDLGFSEEKIIEMVHGKK